MSLRRVLLLIIGYGAGICAAIVLIVTVCKSDAVSLITHFGPQQLSNAPSAVVEPLQPAKISLPAPVQGTPLVAEQLISYDGAFMEDLSYDEVSNVAALLVKNTSSQVVLRAQITVRRGEMELTFIATQIPPNSSVLVLEENRKSCRAGNYTALFGIAESDSEDWINGDFLKAEASDYSMLAVTNMSDKPLTDVHLYYKNSYADGYFLIGGITHSVRLEKIMPGQTLYLKPTYYAGQYSQIVNVRFKEETPLLQEQERGIIYSTFDKNSFKRGFWGLVKISSGVFSSRILPSSIKITRLPTSLAKPISWVTTAMVMPSEASSFITERTSPTISGSKADVGSSKSIISGSIIKARTIATRCF